MKYKDIGELISAHVQDLVETCERDDKIMHAAMGTLMTILCGVHDNDPEAIIAEIDNIARFLKRGIDEGPLLQAFRSETIN